MEFFKNLKFAWNYAKNQKKNLIWFIIVNILIIVISVVVPILSAKIIVYLTDNEFHQLIYECSGEQLAKNIIKTQMSHYNRIRYLAELNKNISVKTNDEHNMLIDAIRNKDKRMYLRVIKAHISGIFKELDKLKGIYPEYCEKN